MTGLLYAAIVALWAAVLIPMWLRRHDDDQARRIERHRTAMGALARLPETTGRGAAATAARRRNVVLGALAGLVVATGAVWALGYASGWFVTASMVLLASYSAGAFVAYRLQNREESLRALERSSAAREARRDRHRMRPVPSAPDVVHHRPAAVSPSVQGEAWDEVFDQTA